MVQLIPNKFKKKNENIERNWEDFEIDQKIYKTVIFHMLNGQRNTNTKNKNKKIKNNFIRNLN